MPCTLACLIRHERDMDFNAGLERKSTKTELIWVPEWFLHLQVWTLENAFNFS